MAPRNVDQLTTVYGPTTWDVYDELDQSLLPSGPDELFDIAGAWVSAGDVVLDAGCRDGTHLIELARRFGVVGIGVEPVPIHVERARDAVEAASLTNEVTIHEAVIQSMPVDSNSVDLIWCRDVFEQLDDVDGALASFANVAKPGTRLVLFTTVVTDALHSTERSMLRRHMGNIDQNLDRSWLEKRFADAGFEVAAVRRVGTEWREHAEERTQPVSTALLRLARLRRRSGELVAAHGQPIVDHVEANLHWELFQFLGKLEPLIYTLVIPSLPADPDAPAPGPVGKRSGDASSEDSA